MKAILERIDLWKGEESKEWMHNFIARLKYRPFRNGDNEWYLDAEKEWQKKWGFVLGPLGGKEQSFYRKLLMDKRGQINKSLSRIELKRTHCVVKAGRMTEAKGGTECWDFVRRVNEGCKCRMCMLHPRQRM